ncbi:MAG: FAD-dependent oxidoreductase [Chloroflexota bacterium]
MIYDIMIIGAGPAGLSAAVYVARKKLNAVLVSADIGGQVNNNSGVENYLGYQFIEGPELISKFQEQVSKFPIEQKIGESVTELLKIKGGFEAAIGSGERIQAKAVVLATGKRPKRLNVPGEKEFMGRGVTYCAICDGPLFAGEKVAVVGNGNLALEAALDMVNLAEHISFICPRELVGDVALVSKLKAAKNVTIYTGWQVEGISGDKFVGSLSLNNLETGAKKKLALRGVFIEVGLEPSSDMASSLVKLNQRGEVPISCACETTLPGLFAAGDVTDVSGKQIIIAAGEGAKAALSAHRYLQYLS